MRIDVILITLGILCVTILYTIITTIGLHTLIFDNLLLMNHNGHRIYFIEYGASFIFNFIIHAIIVKLFTFGYVVYEILRRWIG